MESLLKFYKDILEMLNLSISEDGKVCIVIDGVSNPLLLDGLPMYLPTKNNISTMYDIVDGKSVKVKELFNPLDENSVKVGNNSFVKLKNIMELNFLSVFYHTAEAILLRVANSTDENDMNIIKFISLLAGKKGGARELINDKTLIKWDKIYRNIRLKYINKKYIKLLVTKGGKIDNVKYNRVGVITFPLGEELLKMDKKNNSLLDVKLLNKDINVFKTVFEYLIGDVNTINDGIQIGSLNKIAPSTHALLLMYDKLYKMFKPTIDTILKTETDQDIIDRISLKELPVDIANLSSVIDGFEQYIRMIPNTNQLDAVNKTNNSTNLTNNTSVTSKSNTENKDFWSRSTANKQQPVIQQQPVVQQDVTIPPMMNSNRPIVPNMQPTQMNMNNYQNIGNNMPVLSNSYAPPQQQNNNGSVWDRLRTNAYRRH